MVMKPLLWITACACLVLAALGCGHETKSALEKLEADKSLSDDKAVVEMAKAAWLYKVGDDEKFTASKKDDGKLLLTGMTKDKVASTPLSEGNFRQITMEMDAKYMWRLFRSASKRGLDEMVFTHKNVLAGDPDFETYRVRLTMDQLKGISGWDTADPYSVGEYDVLDTDDAKAVMRKIVTTWTVEADNTDKIEIN